MSSRISDLGAEDMDGLDSLSRRELENLPHVVHKVGVPPKQELLKEIKETLKETFLHDDPLRPFKDQPKKMKFVLGLQTVFPILGWGRDYRLAMFKGDLIAGLTIASLCIPQVKITSIFTFFSRIACTCMFHTRLKVVDSSFYRILATQNSQI